jgi:hypothetical protein
MDMGRSTGWEQLSCSSIPYSPTDWLAMGSWKSHLISLSFSYLQNEDQNPCPTDFNEVVKNRYIKVRNDLWGALLLHLYKNVQMSIHFYD